MSQKNFVHVSVPIRQSGFDQFFGVIVDREQNKIVHKATMNSKELLDTNLTIKARVLEHERAKEKAQQALNVKVYRTMSDEEIYFYED